MNAYDYECVKPGCGESPGHTGAYLERISAKGGPFVGACPEHFTWAERYAILVFHDSGDYLGCLTELRGDLVFFDGPRKRDGHPVNMATIYEVRLVPDKPGPENV